MHRYRGHIGPHDWIQKSMRKLRIWEHAGGSKKFRLEKVHVIESVWVRDVSIDYCAIVA